jgi:hypothetical protein
MTRLLYAAFRRVFHSFSQKVQKLHPASEQIFLSAEIQYPLKAAVLSVQNDDAASDQAPGILRGNAIPAGGASQSHFHVYKQFAKVPESPERPVPFIEEAAAYGPVWAEPELEGKSRTF